MRCGRANHSSPSFVPVGARWTFLPELGLLGTRLGGLLGMSAQQHSIPGESASGMQLYGHQLCRQNLFNSKLPKWRDNKRDRMQLCATLHWRCLLLACCMLQWRNTGAQ